jgi:hypothetical protein
MQKLLSFVVIVFLTVNVFFLSGTVLKLYCTYYVGTCHVLKKCVLFSMKWKVSTF